MKVKLIGSSMGMDNLDRFGFHSESKSFVMHSISSDIIRRSEEVPASVSVTVLVGNKPKPPSGDYMLFKGSLYYIDESGLTEHEKILLVREFVFKNMQKFEKLKKRIERRDRIQHKRILTPKGS